MGLRLFAEPTGTACLEKTKAASVVTGAAHLRRKSRSPHVGAAIFKTCWLLATVQHSKRKLMNAAHVRHPVTLQSTVRFHTSLRASCSGNQIAGC